MTEPVLPWHEANEADALIDRLLDLIDDEPEPVRTRLLAAIKAQRHHAYRQPDGSTVVTFDDYPDVQYVIQRKRRLDA